MSVSDVDEWSKHAGAKGNQSVSRKRISVTSRRSGVSCSR
jgi:hypothetical protein